MRHILTLIFAVIVLAAPNAWAASDARSMTPAQDNHHGDSCFGDRYESDADLNEGNEISDRELQDLLEQLNSPGV